MPARLTPMPAELAPKSIVLIGLSGAGKSEAGQLLARRLGARLTDIDAEIERRTGRTIPQIFEKDGEAVFRSLERDLMRDALSAAPHVIVPGGGWAAQSGALEQAAGRAVTVWLRVSPAVAATRLAGTAGRPLVSATEAEASLTQLLAVRESSYATADTSLDTDTMTPAEVVEALARVAGEQAGWPDA